MCRRQYDPSLIFLSPFSTERVTINFEAMTAKKHYIRALHLKDFTAFDDIEINDFSPGVNILIGPNGIGKTHILKVLYCCAWTETKEHDSVTGSPKNVLIAPKLDDVFRPLSLSHLVRLKETDYCEVEVFFSDVKDSIGFKIWPSEPGGPVKLQDKITVRIEKLLRANIVFIPSKEILSHAFGFVSEVRKRLLDFEGVYEDILVHANTRPLKFEGTEPLYPLLDKIRNITRGEIIEENTRFFLKTDNYRRELILVAEGHNKFALLWRLINNGSIEPGSTIFWDEPETSISPKWFKELVEIALELQRYEVQLFVSTHNYPFLKYFDLLKSDDDRVKYYSLYKDDEGSIRVSSTTDYLAIEPNVIRDTYLDLYEMEIRKNLKTRGDS